MTLRNVMMTLLLLCLVGCGCNEDSTPRGPDSPLGRGVVLGLRTQAEGFPVTFVGQTPPAPIDVVFVLDDSDFMRIFSLGTKPSVKDDKRKRDQAAKAIMRNIQATVEARFEAEWTAAWQVKNPGTPAPAAPKLDFAFGVARYEDFGGDFTDPIRQAGPIDGANNDRDARPFILNMPVLRAKHPHFDGQFLAAINRDAPGDGNPAQRDGFTIKAKQDPQTGLEALYQLAAGPNTAFAGGFNGNPAPALPGPADTDTSDSGIAGDESRAINPQTAPGGSGDVPLVVFTTDLSTTADFDAEFDKDGDDVVDLDGAVDAGDEPRPQYFLTDATGTAFALRPDRRANAPAGAMVPTIASGNIGGAGWRPDAARFVILASDIASVAVTETTPAGPVPPKEAGPDGVFNTPDDIILRPPPTLAEKVSSSDGGMAAPREDREVLLGAFDSNELRNASSGEFINDRRIGTVAQGVAPAGAHTVQQTVDALNALNIEVLLIGAPFIGGNDTKPSLGGVNGDDYADFIDYDVFDPTTNGGPDRSPWLWFNAINTLTTPPITSVPQAGRVTPALFAGDANKFWGVYNLGTVWPFNINDPDGTKDDPTKATSDILDVVTNDLAERIIDWVDGGYLAATGGDTRPALPTVTYEYVLRVYENSIETSEVVEPVPSDVIQTAPVDAQGQPLREFRRLIQLPVWWNDQLPAPTDAEKRALVSWHVSEDDPLGDEIQLAFAERNDQVPLPAQETYRFDVTARLVTIGNQVVAPAANPNTDQVAEITSEIKRRGDGWTTETIGTVTTIKPLTNEHDTILQADGSFTVIVRDTRYPAPSAQLSTFLRGCVILNEYTIGEDDSDQVAGSCPWPEPVGPSIVVLKPLR